MQVVDVAIPPDTKSGPHRTIIVAVATLLGFFATCGWFIATERLQRRKEIRTLSKV
jgi:tyrosine-protein kinase Etk/Wzc